MQKIYCLLLFISVARFSFTQQPVDVLHYRYQVEVNDRNDSIYGTADIKLRVLESIPGISLDLAGSAGKLKGMTASLITGPSVHDFLQSHDQLLINLDKPLAKSDTVSFQIKYSGIPADGLIIAKNKYGNRTFFSDNWPNRAHYWLPCVDHPGDKASVEFIITAPDHYQVISNGIKIEETNLADHKKLTHWKEDIPLPTKVMVIAVAAFATQYAGSVSGIPVYSWVYPENREAGFYDYAQALNILPFFIEYVGPYPYKKLANVQSKTMFGGMENASAIFYSEESVTGKRTIEGLLAHEIAHQWFGNMASEKDFSHLWLSEGFATYFTNLYMENKYGRTRLKEMLEEQRKTVVSFTKTNKNPVVDDTKDYMKLLNANSYQKGGWILHMLRCEVGDDVFKQIVRTYYAKFAGGNAGTDDFKNIAEEVSGKNLEQFFTQWLYTPGQPELDIRWSYDPKKAEVSVSVIQKQATAFHFPLEIAFEFLPGNRQIEILKMDQPMQQFTFTMPGKPARLVPDPEIKLLFTHKLTR